MSRSWLRSFQSAISIVRLVNTASTQKNSSSGSFPARGTGHPKTLLLSVCARMKWPSPVIECSFTGPDHRPSFVASVAVFPGSDKEVLKFSSSSHQNKSDAVYEATVEACKELEKMGLLRTQFAPMNPRVASTAKETAPTEQLDEPRDLVCDRPSSDYLKHHPKSLVLQFGALYKAMNERHSDPKEHWQFLSGGIWQCILTGSSPMEFHIISKAASKKNALDSAYSKLLHMLKRDGWFDGKWRPVFHSSHTIKAFNKAHGVTIQLKPIPERLANEMDDVISRAKDIESSIEVLRVEQQPQSTGTTVSEELAVDHGSTAATSGLRDDRVMDMVKTKAYTPLDEQTRMKRSYDLFSRARKLSRFKNQLPLPISTVREEIVSVLNNHRTMIIAGGTGSGKTTQVPQYILEDYVQRMAGADCNIFVTQPRRISAISVSRRIAQERDEELGDTVGYQIRLEFCPPVGNGSMLFLTPALLLRKLWYNPNFEGISHVIVDEVHERDLWTEFLLILLKRALKTNEKLKVVLMSASVDSKKLASYFEDCPVINVEGQNFDVKEHFLDDVLSMTGTKLTKDPDCRAIDYKLTLDMLSYIHENRPEGAILCFLPGWSDIVHVRRLFSEKYKDRNDYVIYPCHSRLPTLEQGNIFNPSLPGVRKIVLATNIAETSITVNDVRYVVNTGSRKAKSIDRDLTIIHHEWASRSSQIQRRGRAGRVSDGECFHLFSKEQLDRMNPYDLPAMLREPMESVVLASKVCCPNEDPEIMLAEALEPPSKPQVDCAIRLLTEMRLVTEEKNLTVLGALAARLGCMPMHAVALIYGAIFRCINPILILTSIFQTDELVQKTGEQDDSESVTKESEVMERFVGTTSSDHLAQVNLVIAYLKASAAGNADEFVAEHCLRMDNLEQIRALRRLFAWELEQNGLCKSAGECLDPHSEMNENSENIDLVKAIMVAGLHRQIVWLEKGLIDRGRILRDKLCLRDESNRRYIAPAGSLFNPRSLTQRDWTQELFFYAEKVLTCVVGVDQFKVDGLSVINPMSCLLFTSVEPIHHAHGAVNLQGNRCQLLLPEEDINRLLQLRAVIRKMVNWKLDAVVQKDAPDATVVEQHADVERRLISLLKDLLAT